jgi:uncharacterized coiled-coil protein SlyX
MSRLLLIPALALALTGAEGQSQQVDDLRRRVEEVERQLFQQRLTTPVSPQGQAVERLQMRLEMLERELASQRISDVAAGMTTRQKPGTDTLLERVEALEKKQAEDAKTIASLAARVAKLEKPAPRIVPLKKER